MKRLYWLPAAALFACGGGDGGGHEEPASSSAPVEPAESATDTIDEAPQLKGEGLAAALNDSNVFLLDVRNPEELEELGTVEGYTTSPSTNLPIGSTSYRRTNPSSPPETAEDERATCRGLAERKWVRGHRFLRDERLQWREDLSEGKLRVTETL